MLLISIANTQIEIEHTKQKYRPPLLIEPFAKAGVMRGQLRWNLGVLSLLQQKQNTADSADRISTVTNPNQSSQKVTRKKQGDKGAEA